VEGCGLLCEGGRGRGLHGRDAGGEFSFHTQLQLLALVAPHCYLSLLPKRTKSNRSVDQYPLDSLLLSTPTFSFSDPPLTASSFFFFTIVINLCCRPFFIANRLENLKIIFFHDILNPEYATTRLIFNTKPSAMCLLVFLTRRTSSHESPYPLNMQLTTKPLLRMFEIIDPRIFRSYPLPDAIGPVHLYHLFFLNVDPSLK